jgi:putative peptide zinc metalloprotease protein
MALVQLRDDLRLHPGAPTRGGEPTWTIEDALTHRFVEIDWPTFEILKRWSYGTPEAVCEAVAAQTMLDPQPDDVLAVQDFLLRHELVAADDPRVLAGLIARERGKRRSLLSSLLHGYLFMRFPLVDPDAWLAKNPWLLRGLASRGVGWLTVLAFFAAALMASRQWGTVGDGIARLMSLSSVPALFCALFFAKAVHELAHASTARRLGCRVPTMGIAVLVLCPLPYTDTTDSWRLTDPRARLQVAFAGIRAELLIAVWASLAWVFLAPGFLRDICFILASSTWISTLVVNASPFMRFDGYFMLCDWLNLPNLHERSSALARARLRRWLFGALPAPDESPDEGLSPPMRRFMVGFALMTWLYRFTVFVGIALLVYHFFFKLLGLLLFAVEIWWFILRPVWREIAAWRAPFRQAPLLRRGALLLAAAGLAGAPFAWQPETGVALTGVLQPREIYRVHAGTAGQLTALREPGTRLQAGERIGAIAAPEQQRERELLGIRAGWRNRVAASATLDDRLRQQAGSLRAEEAHSRAERSVNAREIAAAVPAAPFAATLRDLGPELQRGVWVARNEPLAILAGATTGFVDCYVDETLRAHIKPGDRARFALKSDPLSTLPLEVVAVDHEAVRLLDDPAFAVATGGNVPAVRVREGWQASGSYYRVRLRATELPDAMTDSSWRGLVILPAPGMGRIEHALRWAAAVAVRELGF